MPTQQSRRHFFFDKYMSIWLLNSGRFGGGYSGGPGSDGPNSPGTTGDDATVGTASWSNTSNAAASDDSYTNVVVTADTITHYLKLTNFGFAIPTGATIVGVTVEIEKKMTNNTAARHAVDYSVKLVKGGTISGDDKADTVTKWPLTDTYRTHGGSADMWGLSLSPADINASDFGVVISADIHSDGPSMNCRIDHVKITVNYT